MMRFCRHNLMPVRYLSNQPSVFDTTALTDIEIPRPTSFPFLGTKLAFLAAGGPTRLHEYIDKRHDKYGHIFCENLNGTDIVFTSDSEYLRSLFIKLEGKYPVHILPEPWIIYNKIYGTKRGLFFMDGEEWLHNRKILNKLLLRETSELWLEEPIKGVTDDLITKWKNESKAGVIIPDLDRQFYRFSIDVLVSILTGNSKASKSKQYDYFLDLFAENVQKIFKFTTQMYLWPSVYVKLNLSAWRDFKKSVDFSLRLSRKLVQEIVEKKDDFEGGLICKLINENVPEEDITRIIADFIIAAGDTTSYTLQWALYMLSNNKDVASELRESNDVKNALHVVRESMRLYPVAPFLTRVIPKDCKLGPYTLKEGTPIVGSIYTSGRSSSYFSEPHKFIPRRWERDESVRIRLPLHTPSATLPFALGARSCIGKKIAQIQLVNAVKAITNNFDLKLLNKQKVDAITSLVLVPKDTIKIEFKLKN